MSSVNILQLLTADAYRPEEYKISIREFYELYKAEEIPWLPHPHLQRNSTTWPRGMNKKIIESIVTNKLVNPILISIQPDGTAFILEGSHRGDETTGFVDNKFSVYGKKLSQWTKQERELFMRKTIKIVRYHNLTLRDEEDIMKRVNLGLQFTIGEHLNATPSIPICALARTLGERFQMKLISNTKCLRDNVRGESTLFAFMILRNFVANKLISTEQPKPDGAAQFLDTIETYRCSKYNESELIRKFELLMDVFEQAPSPSLKLYGNKYMRYTVMTTQQILLDFPTATPRVIRRFIDALYITPKANRMQSPLEFVSHWFKNVPSSNPSNAAKCVLRSQAFAAFCTSLTETDTVASLFRQYNAT
tara:strand:- start:67 stop:1155 length:1089 start_codon:yes stop_codon:yes gene_type:complete